MWASNTAKIQCICFRCFNHFRLLGGYCRWLVESHYWLNSSLGYIFSGLFCSTSQPFYRIRNWFCFVKSRLRVSESPIQIFSLLIFFMFFKRCMSIISYYGLHEAKFTCWRNFMVLAAKHYCWYHQPFLPISVQTSIFSQLTVISQSQTRAREH